MVVGYYFMKSLLKTQNCLLLMINHDYDNKWLYWRLIIEIILLN